MPYFSVFNFFRPSRIRQGLARRGFKGALFHALRRCGTAVDQSLVGPYLLRINPMGAVCNHACPMCWLQHQEPDHLKEIKKIDREQGMRLDEYRALFDAMPAGLEEVNIVGGGEPLIHPEILEIMSEIKGRGLRGYLITNGTLLKEPVARRLVEIGWDVTRISVHAGDAATHAAIHGVGRFDILRENLKRFDRLRRQGGAAERCRFIMLHVLQGENIGAIDRLFTFAEEVGVDEIIFEKLIPYPGALNLSAEQWRRTHDALVACARNSSVKCNLDIALPQFRHEEDCAREGRPYRPAARCSVGFDQAFVTSMGDVLPCCFSDEVMGNLRKQSFRQIWKGKKYSEFRSRLMAGRFSDYCIANRCAITAVLHN
jgi:MoaA/NifB/PqqE/SkfB family radical SAM enzyme